MTALNHLNTTATTSELPTVNNATLTIQRNGSTIDTFTANDATNTTANITAVTSVATGGGLTGGTITNTGTISHADTSSQGTISNNGQFINGLTLDTYGHVTGFTRAAAGGSGNNTSTTAVGAYAMMAATNPTNQNTGINTSFSGNTSVYQYGGVSAGVNNYTFNSGSRTEFPRNGNIPSGTWRFRAAGGTNTGRCVLVQRVS